MAWWQALFPWSNRMWEPTLRACMFHPGAFSTPRGVGSSLRLLFFCLLFCSVLFCLLFCSAYCVRTARFIFPARRRVGALLLVPHGNLFLLVTSFGQPHSRRLSLQVSMHCPSGNRVSVLAPHPGACASLPPRVTHVMVCHSLSCVPCRTWCGWQPDA